MTCKNHPNNNYNSHCENCGNKICHDCLLMIEEEDRCIDCREKILRNKSEKIEEKPVMQQQQSIESHNESTNNTSDKKSASKATSIKMIISIIILLIGIVYTGSGIYHTGLLLILIGYYWFPPIMHWTQSLLLKYLKFKLPLWLQIIASIILLYIATILGPFPK